MKRNYFTYSFVLLHIFSLNHCCWGLL